MVEVVDAVEMECWLSSTEMKLCVMASVEWPWLHPKDEVLHVCQEKNFSHISLCLTEFFNIQKLALNLLGFQCLHVLAHCNLHDCIVHTFAFLQKVQYLQLPWACLNFSLLSRLLKLNFVYFW